jgi:hypothetical protein
MYLWYWEVWSDSFRHSYLKCFMICTWVQALIFKLEETDSLIHEIIKPMAAPFVILPSQHACQIRRPHTAWNRWLYLAFVVAGMSMLYIAIVSTVWPSEQLTEVCSPTLFLCFQWYISSYYFSLVALFVKLH